MRVAGQVMVNEIALASQAARDDVDIAFLPEVYPREDIRLGCLAYVLQD